MNLALFDFDGTITRGDTFSSSTTRVDSRLTRRTLLRGALRTSGRWEDRRGR